MDNRIVIGFPSGDYEDAVLDVSYEEFVKVEGQRPLPFHRSFFNVGLYQSTSTGVQALHALDKYKNSPNLLEITYNDNGIVDIKETNIPALYRYDGYENHWWFTADDGLTYYETFDKDLESRAYEKFKEEVYGTNRSI